MDENKNTGPRAPAEQNTHPAPDTVRDYDDPDRYLHEYMYNDVFYDSMCLSCAHWLGGVCGAKQGICKHEPF